MTNGGNHSAAISGAGEIDIWTFQANAGETLTLSVAETGATTNFFPYIRLQSPGGAQLTSNWGAVAAEINHVTSSSGTYTVLISSADSGNAGTGSYILRLAQVPVAFVVPGGDEGGPLTNGGNHIGTIATSDLDLWSFQANAGQTLTLSVAESGATSNFFPYIRLRGPNGAQVTANWGAVAAEINHVASQSGTYTVLISSADSGTAGTGDYVLRLAQVAAPFVVPSGDEGGAMTNGANHAGTIATSDLDLWSFQANSGDTLTLSVAESGATSNFFPYIRLRAPNGAQVTSNWGAVAAEINHVASQSGTYTVLVSSADSSTAGTGNYVLRLAQTPTVFIVPSGDEGGAMTNGANHTGNIATSDLDLWSFQATAGQTLTLSVAETGATSNFFPYIRLRGPNGAQVTSNWGAVAAEINHVASLSGTYTVLVSSADSSTAGTGDYILRLAQSPAPFVVPSGDEGGLMTNGANHPGAIGTSDLDLWSFQANAGDTLTLSVAETGATNNFFPYIRLRAPNGAQVTADWGAVAAEINHVAASSGTYTVLISSADSSTAGTGAYVVRLARSPAAYIVPTGDEGGGLNIGPNPGAITTSDLDMWTLEATAGQTIILSVGETGPTDNFFPYLRLRGPNGAQVAADWGAAAAQVQYVAQQTGAYTVLISSADSSTAGTGAYTLTSSHAGRRVPTVSGTDPLSGSGATKIFTFRFTDPGGVVNLNVANVLINRALDGGNACYIAYVATAGLLFLVPDAGPDAGLLGPLVLGTASTVANNQCTISGTGSSATTDGNTLTLVLNITFHNAFAGNRVVYLAARNLAGENSGWSTMGFHAVPGLPVTYPNPISMTPAAGSTATATLAFDYEDASDANNLQTVWALVNTALDARQACYIAYYVPGNLLLLFPDNGDGAAVTVMPLAGAGTLENSQCKVEALGSSAVKSGARLTLNLKTTLKTGFAGNKAVWMALQTLTAITSSWKVNGAWLVPQ